jgi:hypothetical protein
MAISQPRHCDEERSSITQSTRAEYGSNPAFRTRALLPLEHFNQTPRWLSEEKRREEKKEKLCASIISSRKYACA